MADVCAFGGHMGGMYSYGWLYQILIFIIFFLIVYWLIKSNQNTIISTKTEELPIDILKRRLAKGDITKKEFESLKKEIEE